MNFLAHAVFAARRRASTPYVLGSMLPDLAGVAGLRIVAITAGELREGVDFHHASDEAFHGAPTFLELMSDGRDELEAHGVALGAAMAASHVGLELLLDGWLAEATGTRPYRQAMNEASELTGDVQWNHADGGRRFSVMCSHLIAAPIPEGYVEPDFVAERLERILARRPRLAFRADEGAEVRAWLARMKPRLWARAEPLLAEVSERLAAAPS